MTDLISRAALLDEFRSLCGPQTGDGWDNMGVRNLIMRQKAVYAVPVVHGRWIDENPDDSLDPRMRCSICTGIESPLLKWRYCPNCGAKMDRDKNIAFADQSGAEYADNPTV